MPGKPLSVGWVDRQGGQRVGSGNNDLTTDNGTNNIEFVTCLEMIRFSQCLRYQYKSTNVIHHKNNNGVWKKLSILPYLSLVILCLHLNFYTFLIYLLRFWFFYWQFSRLCE